MGNGRPSWSSSKNVVYFDMPPDKTLAEVGTSSKVFTGEKHSLRLTAVLTIRSDGTPLREILELESYPAGHHYAVQKNVWMDERVWYMYIDDVLVQGAEVASDLLVDNLKCHMSEESHDKVAEAMFTVVEPLPANSMSRSQPLDVGVMGPLKAMLKTEWLLEEDNREGS
ncbi:hypothetical protein B5M09_013987 [Aphanomyces astaci]|uniref:DDE-1 domain-containing protein n=1 Tax=Aphanomyces astaci TaxID=112090 RepID=A0A3R7WDV0_APHAT|nr:hypothetical protein B5M09_013987 [Aphanomyces astaci]